MHTHALTAAMTLYRSGTLSLDQAAEAAGLSDARMRTALRRHGIPLRSELPDPLAADGTPAGAD
jgi:predicted HTH domain antitoxin